MGERFAYFGRGFGAGVCASGVALASGTDDARTFGAFWLVVVGFFIRDAARGDYS